MNSFDSFNYNLRPGKKLENSLELLNNEKPTISIITPFYNAGKTLKETFNSVMNQTYPYFEWIIVDDGSKNEEDVEILKSISKLDPRIKIFTKENSGPSHTRDYAVNLTDKGTKYLLFLDADDLIDKNFIESAYWTLETNKEASWAYCNMVNFGGQEFLWDKYFTLEEEKKNNILNIMSLVNKKAFLSVGGFEIKEKSVYEDWNLWLKMLAKGMFPVKMNDFHFWYRKSAAGGNSELSRAKNNHENAMKYINETIKTITKDVEGIHYPHSSASWDSSFNYNDSMILPMYKKNKKKKILFILPWLTVGGADKFNLDLIQKINKEEFEIIISTTEPSKNEWLQDTIPYVSEVHNLPNFINREYWPQYLDYIIKSRNIDMIFISNSFAGYYLLPYLKIQNPNIKIVDYVHSEDLYSRNGGYARDASVFGDIIDKTLVCTKYLKSYMEKKYNYLRNSIETVYIGTDEEKFNPKLNYDSIKTKLGIEKNKKIILFVGRLSVEKRPLLFIDIAKKITDISSEYVFLVVGDGPLLEECKKRAKSLKITDKIYFVGFDNQTEKYYKEAHVTINCSIREGLALIAYESLSMGIPVIASDVGGQAELINDKVGKIVPCLQSEKDKYITKYSEKEITNYINAFIYVNKNYSEISSNCRKVIIDKFSTTKMVENIEKSFIKVLNSNSNKNFAYEGINNIIKDYWTIFTHMDHIRYTSLCGMYNNEKYNMNLNNGNSISDILKKMSLKGKYNINELNEKQKIMIDAIKFGVKTILLNIKYLFIMIVTKTAKLFKFIFGRKATNIYKEKNENDQYDNKKPFRNLLCRLHLTYEIDTIKTICYGIKLIIKSIINIVIIFFKKIILKVLNLFYGR